MEPLSLLGMGVADPSDRKSAVLAVTGTQPLRTSMRQIGSEMDREVTRARAEHKAAETAVAQAEKALFLSTEGTLVGLEARMVTQGGTCAIFAAEGGLIQPIDGRYADGRGLTSTEAWTAAAPTLLLIVGLLAAAWKAFPHLRRLFRMIECQASTPERVKQLQTQLDEAAAAASRWPDTPPRVSRPRRPGRPDPGGRVGVSSVGMNAPGPETDCGTGGARVLLTIVAAVMAWMALGRAHAAVRRHYSR